MAFMSCQSRDIMSDCGYNKNDLKSFMRVTESLRIINETIKTSGRSPPSEVHHQQSAGYW